MIRTIVLNFYCRFKAFIVVVYALHVVLLGFYKNRRPYRELILFPLYWKKLQRGCCFSMKNLKSAIVSIKAINGKNIQVNSKRLRGSSISTYVFEIIGVAWFGEKMNINIKVKCADLEDLFDNFELIRSPKNLHEGYTTSITLIRLWQNYAKFAVPAEFGYKVISELAIKADFREQADEWINSKPQGNWVGIHYRGTDINISSGYRLVSIENYVAYLKGACNLNCVSLN